MDDVEWHDEWLTPGKRSSVRERIALHREWLDPRHVVRVSV